jgi:GNAT superfamily N-acetyltransferase
MTIERYRPEWLEAMVGLWNVEMGADFPMSERLFRQNVLGMPSFEPDDILLVTEGEKLLGFVVTKPGRQFEPGLWFGPEDGWVNSIVVERSHRRKGIGTALLGRAEAYLRSLGARRIFLGTDLHHFFPGIPVQYEAAQAFATARGYTLGGIAHDLWRDLTDYEVPERVREVLERESPTVQIRPGTREDMTGFAKFMADEFPGRWRWECLHFLEQGGDPAELTLLFEDGQVAGFSQTYSYRSPVLGSNVMWHPLLGERFGGLGPIGIAERLRGRGLGLALLCESVADLKRRGVERMVIDWTGLVDFYGKIGFTVWKSYRHAEKGL